MVKREKSNYMIQSVSHALDVLEELCKSRGELGVTELSKRLKLHKNNVFRLLATLELRGYVEQNLETEDYRLGVKALELGQSYLLQSNIVERATPILEGLCNTLNETVSFATLNSGIEIQYPISIESSLPVKCTPRVAVSFAAKKKASGRLLIANLTDSELDELLSAENPIDMEIRNMIPQLRDAGHICDEAQLEQDVVTFSVLVKGDKGRAIGVVEVLAPKYRADIEAIKTAAIEAAEKISTLMGSSSTSLSSSIQMEINGEGAATIA